MKMRFINIFEIILRRRNEEENINLEYKFKIKDEDKLARFLTKVRQDEKKKMKIKSVER